jgi:predicted dehydrogenase
MSQTKEDLRWALIGASDIAKTRMINAINAQPNSRVAAVFSSNADRANAYAAENKIPRQQASKFMARNHLSLLWAS